MLVSDGSEDYDTLKELILKRLGLTNRQSLTEIFHKIGLQQGSATEMLLRM